MTAKRSNCRTAALAIAMVASLAQASFADDAAVKKDGAALAAGPPLVAGTFDPPRAAPDFTLRGSNGKDVKLADYRGKIVILEFGFTSCPDICPTTLATLARARKLLGTDAESLQVVYVTVDPERDTVEKLKTYLEHFDPSFIGGTGTEPELSAVRQAYGIMATREAEPARGFSHSSYTYLIDRTGRLRALMPYGQTADAYVHDVKILLKE